MNCLHYLTYGDFTELVEDILELSNWGVRNAGIQDRTLAITGTPRFETLKSRAIEKSYKFNDGEIVTWIDSLSILYRVFNQIPDERLREKLIILQEYCIPYSNKRADFLLVHHNKILILEFSFRKMEYEFQYETKLSQAIGYKELLSSILPNEIEIGTYTFLVEAEEDDWVTPRYIGNKRELPNDAQIANLAKYIEMFFNKNKNRAINELMLASSKAGGDKADGKIFVFEV